MLPRSTSAKTPALRYWRGQRALLQRELAEHASVAHATVQRMEGGLRAKLETVRRLAEALDVDPGDLMRQPPDLDDALVYPPAQGKAR